MKRAALGMLVIALMAATSLEAAPRIAVLDLVDAPKLFEQCSRPTPTDVESFWVPPEANIAAVEAELPRFLASQALKPAVDLAEFNREYAGFVRHGRRYIYGSFYAAYVESGRRGRVPTIICDGGNWFWGVVYDVESKTFSELEFNGIA